MGYKLIARSSNKHVHLSQEDLDTLFGKGYELTKKKDLVQPGQFATEEKVDIVGPKGKFTLRVLGPVRPHTQVELAITDCRKYGFEPVVRESGHVDGTPGCKIIGPEGEVDLDCGVMVAKRHAHFRTDQAEEAGVKDGQLIKLKIMTPERSIIFDDVVVRAKPDYLAEVHLDTDEANACGMGAEVECEIVD